MKKIRGYNCFTVVLYLNFFILKAGINNLDLGRIGLTVQLGTHIQRLGLNYQLYYIVNNIQLNQGAYIYFNRKNLGPQKKGFELQTNIGFQYTFGSEIQNNRYYFSEYTLMTKYKKGTGFMYTLFLDQVNTSQSVGAVFFNFNRFGFIFQNDFLGIYKGYEDKYRTGAFSVSYILDSLQLSIQTTQWTGFCKDRKKYSSENYPSKHGYKNLNNATYGNISHGILALRMDYNFMSNQSVTLESGIDAEQVRNALQNIMFHEYILSWLNPTVDNPHIPMLQKDGTPYLFEENQKIRPVKPYLQSALNGSVFY